MTNSVNGIQREINIKWQKPGKLVTVKIIYVSKVHIGNKEPVPCSFFLTMLGLYLFRVL